MSPSSTAPVRPQWPSQVKVVEVGLRDGLQNEPDKLSVDQRVHLARKLLDAGVLNLEIGSFVHPEWVPQLADTEAVAEALMPAPEGARLSALVPNMKGFERIQASPLDSLAVFVSACEGHNRSNLNRNIEESLDDIALVLAKARSAGYHCRGYLSMVFGSPYQPEISPQHVAGLAERLFEMGVDELSLGDTVGVAHPAQVFEVIEVLRHSLDTTRLALHLHDTYGRALANATAGLQAGITIFDASIGGLGGCPYASGATGNLATEDLVATLIAMGIETGISLPRLLGAAEAAGELVGRQLPSRTLMAVGSKLRTTEAI